MAKLPDNSREARWAEFMRVLSSEREPLGALTKQELRAAFNAADDWVDNNSASFNSALPQPARGALTASQKARLLMMIVEERFVQGV